MEEKLKTGYELFIKKDTKGDLIGAYRLTENDTVIDFNELDHEGLGFMANLSNIKNSLGDYYLVMSYNKEDNRFISSLKALIFYGDYNENRIFETIKETSSKTALGSVLKLNNECKKEVKKYTKAIRRNQ